MRPYYEADGITIYHGDCREVLTCHAGIDCVVADPPYGQTSLSWDVPVVGWLDAVAKSMKPQGSVWCFGSLRSFLNTSAEFFGWKLAQDIIWEKHNGSNFHADRFRRVHEQAAQWYRGQWGAVYKAPVFTQDATARTVRRKGRPPHTGHIESSVYTSEDGGPRLQRSVMYVRSCHGSAENETQKPVDIITPLISYSCPADGVVCDPFGGSGSTAVAAKLLGRRAVIVELREAQCEIAVKRLMVTSVAELLA